MEMKSNNMVRPHAHGHAHDLNDDSWKEVLTPEIKKQIVGLKIYQSLQAGLETLVGERD